MIKIKLKTLLASSAMLLLLQGTLQAAETASLQSQLDQLIDKALPFAEVSVLIKDTEGKLIYARDSHKFRYPASSTKLFTTAAALYQLGPNYQFSSRLLRKGETYYLQFDGDPSLNREKLLQLLLAFKNAVPKPKAIVLDSSRFQAPYYAAGTSYDDLGFDYAAPSTALILGQNKADYDFITGQTAGDPVKIIAKSAHSPIKIENQLITVDPGEAKTHCSFNIDILGQNQLKLYGCFAKADKPKEQKLAISDPLLFAKDLILDSLKSNHIDFKGSILEGISPQDAETIAVVQSEPLKTLLVHMLEESDNLYADALTKTLGYSLTKVGSYKEGAFAIKALLAKFTKVDTRKIKLADGFGSRYDLATAEEFVNLLSQLYQDKQLRPILMQALPHMGRTGTLKNRMKDSALENRVLAKTGSLQDTSSLSGYLLKSDQKVLIFSIISNQVEQDIKRAKALEENILSLVFKAP